VDYKLRHLKPSNMDVKLTTKGRKRRTEENHRIRYDPVPAVNGAGTSVFLATASLCIIVASVGWFGWSNVIGPTTNVPLGFNVVGSVNRMGWLELESFSNSAYSLISLFESRTPLILTGTPAGQWTAFRDWDENYLKSKIKAFRRAARIKKHFEYIYQVQSRPVARSIGSEATLSLVPWQHLVQNYSLDDFFTNDEDTYSYAQGWSGDFDKLKDDVWPLDCIKLDNDSSLRHQVYTVRPKPSFDPPHPPPPRSIQVWIGQPGGGTASHYDQVHN
jgi:hypothetical protein